MSNIELATFLHDLGHDVPNWQARLNQYRGKLHAGYQMDAMLVEAFKDLDNTINSMQHGLTNLAEHETLAKDVWLNNRLEMFSGSLDSIGSLLSEAPSMEEFSSPALRGVAALWAHTELDVVREVHHSSERFFGHTLATADEADIALAGGCGGVFPGRQRGK